MELAAVLEDSGNMAVLSAGAAGGAAGSTAGGAAAGASPFSLIQHACYYTFCNVFKTGGYLLNYNPINFKEKIMEDKILCVEGQKIHTAHSNSTEMTVLFLKLYDQYLQLFMNYVFQTFTESAKTLKNSTNHFHSYIFTYKTDTTPVVGGSWDYQNFCNKIVISTILSTYNSAWPFRILQGIAGDKNLQLNYFVYPEHIAMEQSMLWQLQLDHWLLAWSSLIVCLIA